MGIIKTGKIQSHGDIVGLTTRIASLEDKYVKALWYAEISSGTSGTITAPANGAIVLNEFGNDVDAVTSTIVTGKKPDFVSAKTSAGAIVTATLAANGAWTISAAPSAYPIAIVYVYEVKLVNFDHDSSLYEEEISQGVQPSDGPTFDHVHLTSGQVGFPATQAASSDPNTLDDYEEGTFQVTMAASTSGTITIDTTMDTMSYVKIGRLVFIAGSVVVTSVSSPVGNWTIQGLPFTCATGAEGAFRNAFSVYGESLGAAVAALQARVIEGGTAITVRGWNGTAEYNIADKVAANTTISISGFYVAA